MEKRSVHPHEAVDCAAVPMRLPAANGVGERTRCVHLELPRGVSRICCPARGYSGGGQIGALAFRHFEIARGQEPPPRVESPKERPAAAAV